MDVNVDTSASRSALFVNAAIKCSNTSDGSIFRCYDGRKRPHRVTTPKLTKTIMKTMSTTVMPAEIVEPFVFFDFVLIVVSVIDFSVNEQWMRQTR